MKHLTKAAIAAGTLVLFGSTAGAATIATAAANCDPNAQLSALNSSYFADFASFSCGTSASRQDIGNVELGAGDGDFFSLGLAPANFNFGATAAFEIAQPFTGGSTVVEVTNTPSAHWEAAGVYVGSSLSDLFYKFISDDNVGIVNNGKGGTEAAVTSVSFTGTYTWIGFVDKSYEVYGNASAGNLTQDGFDIDSFSVNTSEVPLPAAGLLLMGALAGIGAMRRRKA